MQLNFKCPIRVWMSFGLFSKFDLSVNQPLYSCGLFYWFVLQEKLEDHLIFSVNLQIFSQIGL